MLASMSLSLQSINSEVHSIKEQIRRPTLKKKEVCIECWLISSQFIQNTKYIIIILKYIFCAVWRKGEGEAHWLPGTRTRLGMYMYTVCTCTNSAWAETVVLLLCLCFYIAPSAGAIFGNPNGSARNRITLSCVNQAQVLNIERKNNTPEKLARGLLQLLFSVDELSKGNYTKPVRDDIIQLDSEWLWAIKCKLTYIYYT